MIKKTLIATVFLSFSALQAQDVIPYVPGVTEEGIVYFLPKTELEIKVTATREDYTPGELCLYADRYLRTQSVSDMPTQKWSIKAVEVTSIGVPNPKLVYSVKLKEKSAASLVELTDEGIIKAINTSYPTKETPVQPISSPTPKVDARSFMTEEMLLAGSSSKMAELVAKEIYSIRESKNSLTRGQADYMPEDGNALKLMLEKLEEQEKALTGMFTGTIEHTDQTFTYRVSPENRMDHEVLFRFSQKIGVVNRDDLAGEPIYISIQYHKPLPPANEEASKKKKQDGIIYNIPVKAVVTIQEDQKKYYESEIPFAQFGETEILVNDLFNKKNNTRVIFDPTTGGIVKIDKN